VAAVNIDDNGIDAAMPPSFDCVSRMRKMIQRSRRQTSMPRLFFAFGMAHFFALRSDSRASRSALRRLWFS
jgi:hypothetical protein